jgi:hypothetical protein
MLRFIPGTSCGYSVQHTLLKHSAVNGSSRFWECKMLATSLVRASVVCLGWCSPHLDAGDLEATFTMSVCRSSNLQGILTNANFPQIKPSLDAFHKVADEDLRGTRLADETHYPTTKPPKPVELADDTRAAVARFLNRKHSADRYIYELFKFLVCPTHRA